VWFVGTPGSDSIGHAFSMCEELLRSFGQKKSDAGSP